MKSSILLLAFSVLIFTSCTTAYKTGQTPDDVYYSAAKPQEEYAESENKDEERQYSYNDDYYDDRYLRMKVRNRYRWSDLDGWYGYDRYSIGYNYYFGSINNPYNTWNYYYNPYCCCTHNYVFVNPKTPASPPVVKRQFSLSGYTSSSYNNSNNNNGISKIPARTTTRPVYNNSNSNNGLSNKIKTIFSNDNAGSRPSRTYTPSTSGSSGNNNNNSSTSGNSGTSGGSSGNVSRPTRN